MVIMTGRNNKPYSTLHNAVRSPHVPSTSFSRKEGEMKSGGAIFFLITRVEWDGMEAIGARAYGAVSGVAALSGSPRKLRVFGIKKAKLYNVGLYTFRVMQQKELN